MHPFFNYAAKSITVVITNKYQMKTTLKTDITVADICNGFVYNELEGKGLFVSSGGFTSDAKEEARTQERRKVTLLDLENLFDLWVEHYDKLTQEARQRFPLKPIHFLAPAE